MFNVAQPDGDASGVFVYSRHESDLLPLLSLIVLIDAYLINPYDHILCGMPENQHRIVEIGRDHERTAINADFLSKALAAPTIRQCVKIVCRGPKVCALQRADDAVILVGSWGDAQ
jgi:hypothetical protein